MILRSYDLNTLLIRIGRYLLAALFLAGAIQKALNPSEAQALLAGFGLPEALIWPAMIYNFMAALCLIANRYVKVTAASLAFYCIATSAFHFIPDDKWQMSIFVKNWAIAGGLLVLSGGTPGQTRKDPQRSPRV